MRPLGASSWLVSRGLPAGSGHWQLLTETRHRPQHAPPGPAPPRTAADPRISVRPRAWLGALSWCFLCPRRGFLGGLFGFVFAMLLRTAPSFPLRSRLSSSKAVPQKITRLRVSAPKAAEKTPTCMDFQTMKRPALRTEEAPPAPCPAPPPGRADHGQPQGRSGGVAEAECSALELGRPPARGGGPVVRLPRTGTLLPGSPPLLHMSQGADGSHPLLREPLSAAVIEPRTVAREGHQGLSLGRARSVPS